MSKTNEILMKEIKIASKDIIEKFETDMDRYFEETIKLFSDDNFKYVKLSFKKHWKSFLQEKENVFDIKFKECCEKVLMKTKVLERKKFNELTAKFLNFKVRTRITTKVNAFYRVETLMENKFMFWFLYADIHHFLTAEFNPKTNEEMVEMFCRNSRMETTIEERQSIVDASFEWNNENFPREKKSKLKQLNKTLWNYLKTLNPDDEAIIYRGFNIKKDDDVRVGRNRIGNSNYYKQNTGKGISFTINEGVANWFAHRLVFIGSDFVRFSMRAIPDTDIVFHSIDVTAELDREALSGFKLFNIDKGFVDLSSRRIVGKYTIKKKDILFYSGVLGEEEIVALPHKTNLITYKLSKPKPFTTYETSTIPAECGSTFNIPKFNVGDYEEYEVGSFYQKLKDDSKERGFVLRKCEEKNGGVEYMYVA